MDKPIKIIFLTLDFPPISGGISRYLYEIISELPPREIGVIGLPVPNWQIFDDKQSFQITRLSQPSSWSRFQSQLKFLSPFFLKALFESQPSNYVLCGQAHYSLLLPAWIFRHMRHVPYGVFVYGMDILAPQKKWYGRLFNKLLLGADVIFVDSQIVQGIVCDLAFDPENVVVVNPPINSSRLLNRSIREESIVEQYGLKGHKCILTVGRLIERKGHDVVISALPHIIDKLPQIKYLIVGTGPSETALRKMVKERGLEAYVTFAGFVPDEKLSAYYEVCDVFVMISRDISEKGDIEGFGIVYLEANLLGKPVVAGRSGGVPDAVLHEKTGLLVDPTSSQEVAGAILRILNDDDFAQQLGVNGRDRVLTEFNSSVAAEKIYNLVTNTNKVMKKS